MSDKWFVPVFGIVFLFFAAVGVVMLVWPSVLLRLVRNPLQPDTPLNRVYARTVGFLFCLFVLVAVSGAFEGFHKNILIALSISPVMLPILLWILWRYPPLQRVNRRYLVDGMEDPPEELTTYNSQLSDGAVPKALGTSDECRILFAALHNCRVCTSLGYARHLSEMTHSGVPINRVTAEVRTRRHLSDFATYQELTRAKKREKRNVDWNKTLHTEKDSTEGLFLPHSSSV